MTDPKTALMWKRVSEDKCRFDDAVKRYVPGAVRFAGFDDWRLPTIAELKTLIRKGESPAICAEAFPNSAGSFWSSSAYGDNGAWYVSFGYGSVNNGNRSGSFAVRLVRASQ